MSPLASEFTPSGTRLFVFLLDRDLRDCVFYSDLLFDDGGEAGVAMFELSPAEIIRWRMEQAGCA